MCELHDSVNASIGEIRAARREGSRQAASAIATMIAVAVASVGTWTGGTANSTVRIARPISHAPAIPRRRARHHEAKTERDELPPDLLRTGAERHPERDLAAAPRVGQGAWGLPCRAEGSSMASRQA